jgi:hypothetical protein
VVLQSNDPLAQVVALEFTSPLWVTFNACADISTGTSRAPLRLLVALLGFAGI